MRLIFTGILIVTFVTFHAQSDQINQDKYWKYREILKNKFVKIGPLEGESIPMACRIPGYAFGSVVDATGTQLQWKDATITLGYYLIVLATEYKLLHTAGEDENPTLNELYYALNAINRLDLKAEFYLSEGSSQPALNGFLIRDDVPYNFWQNWENDGPIYPDMFTDPGNPNRSDSDYNGLNDNDGTQQTDPNEGNAESLDQITSLLTGLVTVFELVGNEVVQPTELDAPMNINTEARAIALRIIHYVMVNEEDGVFSPMFKIFTQNGELVSRGPDCTGAAWPFIEIALRLDDPYVFEHYVEMLLETEVPIVVSTNDFYDQIVYNNAPCMNALQDQLHDYFLTPYDEPITIAHIPLGMILYYIYRAQDENIDLHVGSTTGCLQLTLADIQNIQSIDLEFPGICEDILYDILLDALTPLLVGLAETLGPFAEFIFNGDNLAVGQPICFPSNSLNHDNVHMILEQVTTSMIWSDYDYIRSISGLDFPYINLLYPVLNNNQQPYSTTYQNIYKTLLDQAPCEGPWQDPLDVNNHAPNNWASACNLFKGFSETGPLSNGVPWLEYSGYFPGIDYMVLHNLYYLLWSPDLPAYKRNVSCECILEFTSESILNTNFTVLPQFSDYKSKGIIAESYLSHNLEVKDGAIIELRNDLVICRENPNLETILTINSDAYFKVFENNTITVRSGNKIVVNNGGILDVGISLGIGDGDAKIILEENAELLVLSNGKITSTAGFDLVMKAGSRFIIENGTMELGNGAAGSSISATEDCLIKFNNSNLIMDTQAGTVWNLHENAEVEIDNSIIEIGDNSNFIFHETSSLTLNSGSIFMKGNTSMKFWESTQLNINGGSLDIVGSTSNLTFNGGHLNIAPNITFSPTHIAYESGFIEFTGNDDHELFTGENSKLLLVGDNNNDVILKINNGADLWNNNFGMGILEIRNATVDLSNSGQLWTDMKFIADNVKFVDSNPPIGGPPSTVQVWHNNACSISNCEFTNSKLYTYNTRLSAYNTDFSGTKSGCKAELGSIYISNCDFLDCSVISQSLSQNSTIVSSYFNPTNATPGVSDFSNVELKISTSTFTGSNTGGIFKEGGKLTLKCNLFSNLGVGVSASLGQLNMSSTSFAGYNMFTNVGTCIELNAASGISLSKGYNDLSGYTDFCIEGTLDYPCTNQQCAIQLDALNNFWGIGGPNDPQFPNGLI